jgi:hypothetical protein
VRAGPAFVARHATSASNSRWTRWRAAQRRDPRPGPRPSGTPGGATWGGGVPGRQPPGIEGPPDQLDLLTVTGAAPNTSTAVTAAARAAVTGPAARPTPATRGHLRYSARRSSGCRPDRESEGMGPLRKPRNDPPPHHMMKRGSPREPRTAHVREDGSQRPLNECIRLSTAGVIRMISIAGKIRKTSGNSIRTGAFCAFSSA